MKLHSAVPTLTLTLAILLSASRFSTSSPSNDLGTRLPKLTAPMTPVVSVTRKRTGSVPRNAADPETVRLLDELSDIVRANQHIVGDAGLALLIQRRLEELYGPHNVTIEGPGEEYRYMWDEELGDWVWACVGTPKAEVRNGSGDPFIVRTRMVIPTRFISR